MKLAALVSGGKDSVFAVYEMMKAGHVIEAMVCLEPENKSSYMYHSVNMMLVPLISEACGIPLLSVKTAGVKEEELREMAEALSRLVAEKKIEGVCCGAIESSYQKTRVEKICDELGLRVFLPLWHRDPAELVSEMIDCGMDIRIAAAAADGFDITWLGRRLDADALDDLKALNRKYYVHIAGEGGEFETAVLDAPFFKKKIVIALAESKWEKDCGEYRILDAVLKEKE